MNCNKNFELRSYICEYLEKSDLKIMKEWEDKNFGDIRVILKN